VFAEQQMGALRAAATVIAAMPADQVGSQAARLAAVYAERYGWHPEEVTREIIDAVERHYQAQPRYTALPAPAAAAVSHSIAPPRPRSAGDVREVMPQSPRRSVCTWSSERG
jgi:hypothetical protein